MVGQQFSMRLDCFSLIDFPYDVRAVEMIFDIFGERERGNDRDWV